METRHRHIALLAGLALAALTWTASCAPIESRDVSLSARAQTCRKLSDGGATLLCGEISYYTTAPNVSYTDSALADALARVVGNGVWPETDKECYSDVEKLFCMFYYRKCSTKTKKLVPICPSARKNATAACSRPGIDLTFADVDAALGGSSIYNQTGCWDGHEVRNDNELVPVLPGSTLDIVAQVDDDLTFEGEIDDEEAELASEIDQLQDEYGRLESEKQALEGDIKNMTNQLSADMPTPCTILDFTAELSGTSCPQVIRYALLPGHECTDSTNITSKVDQKQCPCELSASQSMETPCKAGAMSRVFYHDPVQPVGSSSGEIGVPAFKECDRRYNLMPVQERLQCSPGGPESAGTPGWTFISFNGPFLVGSAAGVSTQGSAGWAEVFETESQLLDGTPASRNQLNFWRVGQSEIRVDGTDPGGNADLEMLVRVPAASASQPTPTLLFVFQAMADLPLAGLRFYVDGFERMQVVNNVDAPIGYAVQLKPGRDSKVKWEFSWASEGSPAKKRQLGGTQYASLSLVALKGASLLGLDGNVVPGFDATTLPNPDVQSAPSIGTTGSNPAGSSGVGATTQTPTPSGGGSTSYIVVGTVGLVGVAGAAVFFVRRALKRGARGEEYRQLDADLEELVGEDSTGTLQADDDGLPEDKLELRRLDYFAEEEHDEEAGSFLNTSEAK